MSTISRQTTWADNQVLTATALNAEFDNIVNDYNGNIANANISASAAIAYSKLNLTGGIVNADVSASAAIVQSKLSLSAADLTTSGIVEIATSAEVNTGTDATRAVSPDGFAGSNFGIRYVEIPVFGPTTDIATGDGKAYFHIPAGLNGMNLVYAHAMVVTAGTTNSTTVQINNVTQAADMLTALLEVETGEVGSDTSAPGVTIDTNNDDVATNDRIRIDVDSTSTTPAKGLVVTLGFQLP